MRYLTKHTPHMPVQQVVFKLVFVATQAAIAGAITISWTAFQQCNCPFEHFDAMISGLFRKAGSAGQSVVKVNFNLLPLVVPALREPRPELTLQFTTLKFKGKRCSFRQGLAQSSQSDICSKRRFQNDGIIHRQRNEQNICDEVGSKNNPSGCTVAFTLRLLGVRKGLVMNSTELRRWRGVGLDAATPGAIVIPLFLGSSVRYEEMFLEVLGPDTWIQNPHAV